jgi:DNA polymerase zeta
MCTPTSQDELSMLEAFADAVVALDPDVLLGWELQRASLGFLVDRSLGKELNLLRRMSRTPETSSIRERMDDEYGRQTSSGIHSTGRIVLNLWRIMKAELKLLNYTLESCAAAVLRTRAPRVTHTQLAAWFCAGPSGGRGGGGGGGAQHPGGP